MGSSAAFSPGKGRNIPTTAENPTATRTIIGLMITFTPTMPMPMEAIPIPKAVPMMLDGGKDHGLDENWVMISLVLAPRDLRMPISRVLSVTETNMIFMIPMPPNKGNCRDCPDGDGKGAEDCVDHIHLHFSRFKPVEIRLLSLMRARYRTISWPRGSDLFPRWCRVQDRRCCHPEPEAGDKEYRPYKRRWC